MRWIGEKIRSMVRAKEKVHTALQFRATKVNNNKSRNAPKSDVLQVNCAQLKVHVNNVKVTKRQPNKERIKMWLVIGS